MCSRAYVFKIHSGSHQTRSERSKSIDIRALSNKVVSQTGLLPNQVGKRSELANTDIADKQVKILSQLETSTVSYVSSNESRLEAVR